jgi:hemolysin III
MSLIKKLREPMNGLTHFIGIIFSIVGTIVLINQTLDPLKPYHFVSFLIFGLGMILLFTTSTLYHWLKLSEAGVKKMRKADHIMIFVYIAASYTPTCVIVLNKNLGWIVLAAVWGVAIAGVCVKIFWMNAPRWLSTIIYLFMGWLAVTIIYPLINSLQIEALLWLLAGGMFYTIGALIYALKKPDPFPGILGFHEIFHWFVLLGSFSHFWLIYNYIAVIKN